MFLMILCRELKQGMWNVPLYKYSNLTFILLLPFPWSQNTHRYNEMLYYKVSKSKTNKKRQGKKLN